MKTSTFLAAGLFLAFLGAAPPARAELAIGDQAPAFSLPGSDGKTYSSADFEGKQAMVMAWYPKAFTGG